MKLRLKLFAGALVFILLTSAPASAAAAGEINEKGNADQQITATYYNVIYRHIAQTQRGLGQEWIDWLTRAYISFGYKWGVNPLLITATFYAESRHNPATPPSRTGAIGPAQLMPDTAAYLGVNPYDVPQNIEGGIRYLREQLDRFQSQGQYATALAIAAYNAGPAAVRNYGNTIPPYEETEQYVQTIADVYQILISEFYAANGR